MKSKLFPICLLVFLVLWTSTLSAQDKTIRGLVTTFEELAVIGAEVHIKSSKEVVKTDSLGRFVAQVSNKDILKIKAKGFFTQKVELTKQTKLIAINLRMKEGEKAQELANEYMAIGYGYVKDSERTTSVSKLDSRNMDFSIYSSMHELIRGRLPGVQVDSNGDIIIRGVNSLNLSSAALIVLDGVPVDKSMLYSISPVNVKRVSVIKDGSSAIYGSRGANGVVIVETKRGKD